MRTAKIVLAYFAAYCVAFPLVSGTLGLVVPLLEAVGAYVTSGFDDVPASFALRSAQRNLGPYDAMGLGATLGGFAFIATLISRFVSGHWLHE